MYINLYINTILSPQINKRILKKTWAWTAVTSIGNSVKPDICGGQTSAVLDTGCTEGGSGWLFSALYRINPSHRFFGGLVSCACLIKVNNFYPPLSNFTSINFMC